MCDSAIVVAPGVVSPPADGARPAIARPDYVRADGRRGQRAADHDDPMVKDADTIERMRRRRADRRRRRGRGRPARRARRHHRRARPDRPRVHARPRRLPVDAGLQGLPEVAVHLGQRGDLPRHPGLPRRSPTATWSRSTSPPTSTACTATPARRSSPASRADEVRDCSASAPTRR